MGTSSIMLIVSAIIVALAAGMIAYKYVSPSGRMARERGEPVISRTKLIIKLIVLGLVAFFGLAVYLMLEQGGG